MARPSSYSETTGDFICERLAEKESLVKICSDGDMPHISTVFRWLLVNDEFRDKYTRAREAQAEAWADEIVLIADTPVLAERVTVKADGTTETVIGDAVERSKQRIEARKWIAARLLPKKYGDKLEHTGEVGIKRILVPDRVATKPSEKDIEPEF